MVAEPSRPSPKLQAISSEKAYGKDPAGYPRFILGEGWGEFEGGDFRRKRNALDGSWNIVSIHPVDYFGCDDYAGPDGSLPDGPSRYCVSGCCCWGCCFPVGLGVSILQQRERGVFWS